MTVRLIIAGLLACLATVTAGPLAQDSGGLRGDVAAIADARAMVDRMGGEAIWRETSAVHFVHEWDFVNRPDRYIENEILDLTGPRSWVHMKSETHERTRAYSPEHGYWQVSDGKFSAGSKESLTNAIERAPYSIYRLARAIAAYSRSAMALSRESRDSGR